MSTGGRRPGARGTGRMVHIDVGSGVPGEPVDTGGSRFTFHALPATEFHVQQGGAALERLKKWDLSGTMVLRAFRFDQQLQRAQIDAFMLDLFNDPNVAAALPVCTGRGAWGPLGRPVSAVRKSEVPTTAVRTDLFDRLYEHGIAARPRAGEEEGGYIAKCLDQPLADGLVASDRLRLLLCDEGSDEWGLYAEGERAELLFRCLRHVCVGGGLCQYEDRLGPLLDATKALYRDLVRVRKNGSTGQLEVGSWTYALHGADGTQLWARESPHNFWYVSVDPLKRHVVVCANTYIPMF